MWCIWAFSREFSIWLIEIFWSHQHFSINGNLIKIMASKMIGDLMVYQSGSLNLSSWLKYGKNSFRLKTSVLFQIIVRKVYLVEYTQHSCTQATNALTAVACSFSFFRGMFLWLLEVKTGKGHQLCFEDTNSNFYIFFSFSRAFFRTYFSFFYNFFEHIQPIFCVYHREYSRICNDDNRSKIWFHCIFGLSSA